MYMCKWLKNIFRKKKEIIDHVRDDNQAAWSIDEQQMSMHLMLMRMRHRQVGLIPDSELRRSAHFRLAFLEEYGKFNHDYVGTEVNRLSKLGYSKVTEILAEGYVNELSTARAWEKSNKHRAIIINSRFTHYGVAEHNGKYCVIFAK